MDDAEQDSGAEAARFEEAVLREHLLAPSLDELRFADVVAAARTPHTGSGQLRGAVLDVVQLIRGHGWVEAHSTGEGWLELRQHSSTIGDDDLDSLPPMDAIALFDRLSEWERWLSASADERFALRPDEGRGWVRVSKHKREGEPGSQRILLSAEEPPEVAARREREEREGAAWPALLETGNPEELSVGEFRGGLVAVVPERPDHAFEIVLYFRPAAKGRLLELDGTGRWGLAQAVREVTGALRLELALRGRAETYRWELHAEPGRETWLHLMAHEATVEDGPADWVRRLRNHLGLE